MINASYYFLVFLGFAVFIAHLELIYILRYNNAICLFTLTLCRAGKELVSIACIGGVIFLAFVSLMTLCFGTEHVEYASFTMTITTLARASLTQYDFQGVRSAFGLSGAFLLTLYLTFVSIIGMNFFITLINTYLEETSDDSDAIQDKSEVIAHLTDIVKSFITTNSQSKMDVDHQQEDAEDDA